MPTLTWGFLMLIFLRPELKTQKPTHKTYQNSIRNQPENSARKFNQKKDRLKRRSLKHLHAVLKQDPLIIPPTPEARRPQGIEKKVLLVRNCCKE